MFDIYIWPKIKAKLILTITIFVVAMTLASTCIANDKIISNVIFDGGWGKSIGQFGRDNSGKTMFEYELSLFVANNEIYILDSMNNRIQIFDNNGNYKRTITLSTIWEKNGLSFGFSIYNDNLYVLTGMPPYYSENGIIDIWKYSIEGKFIKSFGKNFISTKSEDFNHLFSNSKSGHLYVAASGKKVLAINEQDKLVGPIIKAQKGEVVNFVGISPSGNPIVTVTRSSGAIAHTMVIDKESTKVIKTVNGRYSMTDDKGKFISIRTLSASKRERKPMLTRIEVFDSVTDKKEVLELTGDIRVSRNGKEKVYKLTEDHFEASRMDADGAIYHMLALNDGVVVRKITLK